MTADIFIIIFRWYLFTCLVHVLIFWQHVSQYHKIYNTLHTRQWFLNKDEKVILSSPLFTNDMILWKYETDAFSLKNGVYLFKTRLHWLNSPYTIYWLWKYKQWFKKNIDLSDLENIK